MLLPHLIVHVHIDDLIMSTQASKSPKAVCLFVYCYPKLEITAAIEGMKLSAIHKVPAKKTMPFTLWEIRYQEYTMKINGLKGKM